MADVLPAPSASEQVAHGVTVRRAALGGIIGSVMFGFLSVVLTILQYDFLVGLGWRPFAASDVPWPSGLALGPYGWLQVANFVLFGLLLIAFAVGLHRGVAAGRGATIGPALLGVAGSALVLAGFKTDPHLAVGPQTLHGWIHALAFFLLIGSMLPSLFALWWRLRKDARWRGYDWYALVTGVLAVVSFFVPRVGFYVFLAMILTWIVVMALRLWDLSGRPVEA